MSEVSDLEVTMHLYRLLRDGGYRHVEPALKQCTEDLGISIERARKAAAEIALKMHQSENGS